MQKLCKRQALTALFLWISSTHAHNWLGVASGFQKYIEAVDHWVAFVLLGIVGVKMITEAFENCEDENLKNYTNILVLLTLAVATSIDALAVGITFSVLDVQILTAALIIGAITFVLSFVGVMIGCGVGKQFKKSAELIGAWF